MSIFSRFLNIFSAGDTNPEVQPQPQNPPPTSTLIQELQFPSPDMVTTRRQSGNKVVAQFNDDGEADVEGVDKDEIPVELLSPESRKRRREKARENEDSKAGGRDGGVEGDEGKGSKRIKKLPMRRKSGEKLEEHTHWEQKMSVAEVLGKGVEEAAIVKPVEEKAEDEDEADIEAPTPSKSPRSKSKAKSIKAKSKPALPSPAPTPKPTHKKFSEDAPFSAEAAPPPSSPTVLHQAEIQDSDASEDSDNDAPEVIEKIDAQVAVRDAAREATKAAENLAATQRQKRQDRDAQLKAQASDRKRKRAAEPEPRVKITKANLPLVLPDEYLEDDDAEQESAGLGESSLSNSQSTTVQTSSKKMKFVDKKPKDRVGSDGTVFRVAEKRTSVLPPKADRGARSVKEAWLKGRKGAGEKRRGGGGFFVR